jgi:hypothetical protein
MFDRVVQDFASDPEVEHGTMFRSPGLRVGGKIFAFLGHDARLIVKLPRARVLELIAAGVAHEVTMGTRSMREWIAILSTMGLMTRLIFGAATPAKHMTT